MTGFTDIHTHIVYGVDDGPQTPEKMHRLLDAAHRQHILRIYATSHVKPGVEKKSRQLYEQHLEEARQYCAQKGYPLEIFSGAEIFYSPMMDSYMQRHSLPTLGTTRYILVEFVPDISRSEMECALRLLCDSRYIPILAHVERYKTLKWCAASIRRNYPVRFQVDSGAVLGKEGFTRRILTRLWLRLKLVDYVATDMHSLHRHAPDNMETFCFLRRRYGVKYAKKLMGVLTVE